MSLKTSVRTSYRASVLAAENARLCAEQPPAADALQPTLLRRFGFRARLRRSVRRLRRGRKNQAFLSGRETSPLSRKREHGKKTKEVGIQSAKTAQAESTRGREERRGNTSARVRGIGAEAQTPRACATRRALELPRGHFYPGLFINLKIDQRRLYFGEDKPQDSRITRLITIQNTRIRLPWHRTNRSHGHDWAHVP